MRYIEDFKEGDNITGHYLCKRKQTLKSKSGKSYMSLILYDKTGSVDAKVWELNNAIQSFEENDFIKIEGQVTLFNGEIQLKIVKIRKSAEGEYDPGDFVPITDKNVDVLFENVRMFIETVSNPYLKKLLEAIFCDSDIQKAFKQHSAAKSMHHSFSGGLIEHTLSVAEICDFMSGRYKFVNRDLLITSALLHDIGKIYEISAFPENDYTDDGQLLGHIVMASEMISKQADKIDGFPSQLLSLLKHSILAHHGEYEYGSPKRPKTIEAFILFNADNMDAKVKMFEEAIEKDRTPGNWIGYSRIFSRNIRRSDSETLAGSNDRD